MHDGKLVASCSNCASWRAAPGGPFISPHRSVLSPPRPGLCAKSLVPPPGEILCDRYAAADSFQREIVRRMMQDPVVLPVPLAKLRR